VGRDVTNFDVLKLVSHGDAQKRNANITSNVKEVFLCLVGGEGSQVMVVVAKMVSMITKHSKLLLIKKFM
jgi:hypothetical protein